MAENAVPRLKILKTATITKVKETAIFVGIVPVEWYHKNLIYPLKISFSLLNIRSD